MSDSDASGSPGDEDWSRDAVEERLFDVFYSIDHPPHCKEPDPYFEDKETNQPDHDGLLIVKCWNCDVQDHFLYRSDDENQGA